MGNPTLENKVDSLAGKFYHQLFFIFTGSQKNESVPLTVTYVEYILFRCDLDDEYRFLGTSKGVLKMNIPSCKYVSMKDAVDEFYTKMGQIASGFKTSGLSTGFSENAALLTRKKTQVQRLVQRLNYCRI